MKASFPEAAIRLVEGKGGIFDVTCDGRRIFSKHEVQRFPDNGEITELIRKAG